VGEPVLCADPERPSRLTLFLRWALLNVLVLLGGVVLAISKHELVTGLARWFVLAILIVFALASLYAGVLSWRHDRLANLNVKEPWRGVEHVEFAADVCQYLGLIGAAVGFLVALTGDDLGTVQQRVAGASIGLAATAVGVGCSVVLLLEAHLLRHD
jgi:hypothetical protein